MRNPKEHCPTCGKVLPVWQIDLGFCPSCGNPVLRDWQNQIITNAAKRRENRRKRPAQRK